MAIKDTAPVVSGLNSAAGWWSAVIHAFVANIWDEKTFKDLEGYLLGRLLPITVAFTFLPIFFGSMLLEIKGKAVCEWLPPIPPLILDGVLEDKQADALRAISASTPFLGRAQELGRLFSFTRAKELRSGYLVLTGAEGIGKTRLALEWGKQLANEGWDAGILEPSVRPLDLKGEYFRRKTAIIIDDASSRTELWSLVHECISRRSQTIIVLLVDQFVPAIPLSIDDKVSAELVARSLGHLSLQSVSDADLKQIVPGVDEQILRQASGRPLFVMLGNEPKRELKRRASRRLDLASTDLERQIVLMAAMVGPVRLKDLDAMGLSGLRSIQGLQRLFEGMDVSFLHHSVPAIDPAPLGDEIVYQALSTMPLHDVDRIIKFAARLDGWMFQKRLGSLYRQSEQLKLSERLAFIANAQECLDQNAPHIRAEVLAEVKDALALACENGEIDHVVRPDFDARKVLERVRAIAAARPFDRELTRLVCNFYCNIVKYYREADDFEGVFAELYNEVVRASDAGGSDDRLVLGSTLAIMLSFLIDAGSKQLAYELYPSFERIVIHRLNDEDVVVPFAVVIAHLMLMAVAVEDEDLINRLLKCISPLMEYKFHRFLLIAAPNLIDAVNTAANMFAGKAQPHNIVAWIPRLDSIYSRIQAADTKIRWVVRYGIVLHVMHAYARSGDMHALHEWRRRLMERTLDETDEELAWTVKAEVAIAYVRDCRDIGQLNEGERWARLATANLDDIEFDGNLSARLAQFRLIALVMEQHVYKESEDFDAFFVWAGLWWKLYSRLPRAHVAATHPVANACEYACRVSSAANLRDDTIMWFSRLLDASLDLGIEGQLEPNEFVAVAFHNVISALARFGLNDLVRTCRIRIGFLARRYPQSATINTAANMAAVHDFTIGQMVGSA
ncbi:ATP-binding protein [Mesorhizobium sp. BR1-1-13]|uniref:ATP-binding protein n=1 Tax=Mesorhizobium sp. BR1-1-13 TaxID=2876656 RepID=UPI001CD04831|nr:ATP-binding protein [Mesorhizobium sp. BR1-1-13]MBZ9940170.1 ATP-binding protein [Mesorhizobium sp. BR1-1-13]